MFAGGEATGCATDDAAIEARKSKTRGENRRADRHVDPAMRFIGLPPLASAPSARLNSDCSRDSVKCHGDTSFEDKLPGPEALSRIYLIDPARFDLTTAAFGGYSP
jgi:hypothetical protein